MLTVSVSASISPPRARGHRAAWRRRLPIALTQIAQAVALVGGSAAACAAPDGGQVVIGRGSIHQSGPITTITQATARLGIDWQRFSVGAGETVRFVQPDANAVALNRVVGADATVVLGRLQSNGQVFLVNPKGVLFGGGAQVDVGGLVASTLDLAHDDFAVDRWRFGGSSTAAVRNEGRIAAPAGGVVLLGTQVANHGRIEADGGRVTLAAGEQVTLQLDGRRLFDVQIDRGAAQALVDSGGVIRADGGQVLLTARGRDALSRAVVNHTGVIEARAVQREGRTIRLMGDMAVGQVHVAGTLDASAPDGGDGGFVETSAAQVSVADSARVSTQAPHGAAGAWLIDPVDLTITDTSPAVTASSGSTMSPTTSTTISASSIGIALAAGGNVTIESQAGTGGTGRITVASPVSWSSNGTLTLAAYGDLVVDAPITASGTTAGLNLYAGALSAANPTGAAGVLRINAPVTLSGTLSTLTARAAALAGVTGDGLTFGRGGSIDFPAVTTTQTGRLSINGTAYTLYGSLAALDAIDGELATVPASTTAPSSALAITGGHALARNFDATGTAYSRSLIGSNSNITFGGQLEGLGHTVSNLTIAGSAGPSGGQVIYSSFIGQIGTTGAAVSNLGLVDVDITGPSRVGGLLAGMTLGTVSGVYVTGRVTGAGTTTVASYAIGGLIGTMDRGTLQNSWSSAAVTLEPKRYDSSGADNRRVAVGGLVGYLPNNTATGATTAVINTYATGPVTLVGAVPGSGDGTFQYTVGVGGLIGGMNTTSSAGTRSVSSSFSTGAVVRDPASTVRLYYAAPPSGTNATVTGLFYDPATAGSAADVSTVQGGTASTTLRAGSLPSGFGSTAWVASSGNLPYLASQFPRGVQTIAGTAYSSAADAASPTAMVPTSSGAVAVNIRLGGDLPTASNLGGTSSTAWVNANGSYELVLPIGVDANGNASAPLDNATDVLAWTASNGVSAANALGYRTAVTGSVSGLDVSAAPTTLSTAEASLSAGLAVQYPGFDSFASYGTNPGFYSNFYLSALRTLTATNTSSFTVDRALSASSGNVTLTASGAGAALDIGSALAASSGTLTVESAGPLSVSAALSASGSVAVGSSGSSVSLLSGAALTSTGGDVVLRGTSMSNAAGAGVLSPGAGARWLVYLASPSASSYGGLASGNTAVWGTAWNASTPAAVAATNGNRFVFGSTGGSVSPQVADAGKVYGADPVSLTAAMVSYVGSGDAFTATPQYAATAPADALLTAATGVSSTGNVPGAWAGAYAFTVGGLAAGTGFSLGSTTGAFTVSPRSITLASKALTKTYDTTTSTATATGAGIDVVAGTLFSGDTLSGGSTVFVDPNAGTRNVNLSGVTVNDGNGGNNYEVSYAATAGTISPAVINLSGSRTYDRTTDVTASVFGNTIAGVGGQTLTLGGAGSVSSGNASATPQSLSLGSLALGNGSGIASNYTLIGGTHAVTIAAAPITLASKALTKTYDTTTSTANANGAGIDVVSGTLFSGDTLNGGATVFADPNVGTRNVSLSGVTVNDGNAGSNYTLSYAAAAGTIDPAVINLSGSRTYDRTTTVTASVFGNTIAGVGGQTLTLGGTGSVSSGNASATPQSLSLGSLALGNDSGLASNYSLAGGTHTVTIAAAPIALASKALTKTYDTTTSTATATGAGIDVVAGTLFSGDTLSGGSTAFVDPNVGTRNVSLNGVTVNDGNAGNNYTLSYAAAAGTITPAVINLSGSRTYDRTATVTASVFGNTIAGIGGQTLTLGGTGSAASAIASATPRAVSLGSLVLVDGSGLASNYTLSGGTHAVTISAAPITLASKALTKTYDTTTSTATATGGGIDVVAGTLFSGDTLSGGSTTFVEPNAGTRSVNLSGVTVNDGNGGNNYTLSYAAAAGTITPAVINLSGSRTYDRTTDVTASVFGGAIPGVGGQTLTLSGTGSVSSANASATPQAVGLGSLALGNDSGLASNYTLAGGTHTVTIAAAPITLASMALTKTYDTTTSTASATGAGIDVVAGTLFSGDTLSGGSTTFVEPNAGTRNVALTGVTVNDGNSGNNYEVSYAAAAGTISPAVINLSGSRTYDRTTDVTASVFGNTVAGVGGQTLSLGGTGSVTGSNASQIPQAVSLGSLALGNDSGLASNYTLVGGTHAVTITPKSLTPSASVRDKVYDRTTAASLVSTSLEGVIDGDAVSLQAGAATFSDPSVGRLQVTVDGLGLTGADAGNYALLQTSVGAMAVITARPLGVMASVATKTYDATTAATVALTPDDVVPGDSVTVTSTSANFDTRHAGLNKPVVISGLRLEGPDASNYELRNVSAGAAGRIEPRRITLASNALTKTYDGSTSTAPAVGAGLDVTSGGLVGGDTLDGGTTSFADPNAGTRAITLSGVTVHDGNGGNNYAVSYALAAGTIEPAVISLSGTRAYDRSTSVAAAAFGGGMDGVAGQRLGLSGSGSVGSAHVSASARTVGIDGLTLIDGPNGAARNYTLVGGTHTVTITPRAVTANVVVQDKVYDGSIAATIGSRSLVGVIDGDSVVLAGGVAAFADRNAGVDQRVDVGGLLLSGVAAGDYALQSTTLQTSATIRPRPLSAHATALDKLYDRSSAATVGSLGLAGVIGSDAVTVAYAGATFDDMNAGANKPVSVSGLRLAGAAAGNYLLPSETVVTTATIAPRAVVISAVPARKAYDGSIAADGTPTVTGFVAGDTVSALVQRFDNRHAGERVVVVDGWLLDDGHGGANYAVSTAPAAGTIEAAALTLRSTNVSKRFDGSTSTTTAIGRGLEIVDGRLFGGDRLTGGTWAYTDPQVGLGNKTVVLGGVSVDDGNGGANYRLGLLPNTTSSILPAGDDASTGVQAVIGALVASVTHVPAVPTSPPSTEPVVKPGPGAERLLSMAADIATPTSAGTGQQSPGPASNAEPSVPRGDVAAAPRFPAWLQAMVQVVDGGLRLRRSRTAPPTNE